MTNLVAQYEDDLKRRPILQRTRDEVGRVCATLKALLGPDKPIDQISREDCHRVQAVIDKLPANATKLFPRLLPDAAAKLAAADGIPPIKPRTAKKYLAQLSAIFDFAIQEDLLDRNPAKGLRPTAREGRKAEKSQPFLTKQLQAIFDAPLYRGCQNDEAGYAIPGPNRPRRGRFWLPLIALWTGMRENEICQLDVADIDKRDDVDVILVRENPTDDAKRLKT